MERRESKGRVFGELQRSVRDLRFFGLWRNTASESVLEFDDNIRSEILLLQPYLNQIRKFLLVFRAIVEGGSACDQARQYVFPECRKLNIALSRNDMMKHVIQNVQQMKSASFETRPRTVIL